MLETILVEEEHQLPRPAEEDPLGDGEDNDGDTVDEAAGQLGGEDTESHQPTRLVLLFCS